MRMLKTFLSELITQSNTALSLGTLLMVLRGLSTRSTRKDFITPRFSAPELPLNENIIISLNTIMLMILVLISFSLSTYITSPFHK